MSVAQTTNEKVIILQDILGILLNPSIADTELRTYIHRQFPEEQLQTIHQDCAALIRPTEDKSYDYLGDRYIYIRQFAPKFLAALAFRTNRTDSPLMDAVSTLQQLNESGKRKIPADAKLDFVPRSWLPYVKDGKKEVVRRYYEICALSELRSALRSGDIWVEHSRRYADPESYLVSQEKWPSMRPEICRLLGLPTDGNLRIRQRHKELEANFIELDQGIASQNGTVRVENEKLVLSPLRAEDLPESSVQLQNLITQRLPKVELTDLLIEVDSWTQFTNHFEHAGGQQSRNKNLLIHLYASLLAQACNFGLVKMAEISDLTYRQLAWCTNWYVRDNTLRGAIDTLVNFQFHLPLSRYWGGGTMSSSDGQNFPVPVKTRNATFLPKYFGYGRGLTFYSWTSDQFSQYGSKVIPTTVRDATYVLDAILDNETELPIIEHTTDTAGYTERIFAFFDLLGMQFSPRIRDWGDQRIYRIELFANEGKIRKAQLIDQSDQASCLTLVANAIIVWNTRYMQAVIDQLRAEGHIINDSDLAHISPCRFDHINKYGKYNFNLEKEQSRKQLRPLRHAESP